MKNILTVNVCKGKDLEKGDIFYIYHLDNRFKWKVMLTTEEGDLHYGIAVGNNDNYFFRGEDVFVVEDVV